MKTTLNPSQTFLYAAIEVRTTNGKNIESAELIEDICEIRLKDTRGRVHKYFKEDLIEGPDRFLVYIFEVGEGYFKFDIIIKTDDINEFINHVGSVAYSIAEQNFKEQTVLTIV